MVEGFLCVKVFGKQLIYVKIHKKIFGHIDLQFKRRKEKKIKKSKEAKRENQVREIRRRTTVGRELGILILILKKTPSLIAVRK